MTANRDSRTNRPLTQTELDAQLASLRTVGGVYDVVTYWVDHDNRNNLIEETKGANDDHGD